MWQVYIKVIRQFIFLALLAPMVLVAAPQKNSNSNLFVEGQDYLRLPDTIRVNPNVQQLLESDPHKVQVLFFFSYACHGCEMLHTPFEQWANKQRSEPKNKVAIYVYPVAFNSQWSMLARLYYVAQTLDPSGALNMEIFTAIHKKGLKLWDGTVMKKFFVQHGYTEKQFDQAYNSFNVNRQVKRAEELVKGYSVTATPDIIINGPVHSYKIDLVKAGNNIQRMIAILNYLVARESKLL